VSLIVNYRACIDSTRKVRGAYDPP
jgi:hypothetical protein